VFHGDVAKIGSAPLLLATVGTSKHRHLKNHESSLEDAMTWLGV